MDTSDESTSQCQPYVSCITVDGKPILPPLMTNARRAEMRQYRELAQQVENRFREQILSPSIQSTASTESSTSTTSSSVKEAQSLGNDNDSDKENRVSLRGKHVRKLSYTLLEPSAALLAASANAAEKESRESDSGTRVEYLSSVSSVPSPWVTPLKLDGAKKYFEYDTTPLDGAKKYFDDDATPTNQELDNRLDALNRHLAQLQVGLGVNKQEHLERYLGEVASSQNSSPNDDGVDGNVVDSDHSEDTQSSESEIDYRFQKLKETHEKQMAALLEMHNAQQEQLRQDFEHQRNLLIGETRNLSTSSSKLEPFSTPDAGVKSIRTSNSARKSELVDNFQDEDPISVRSSIVTLTYESRPSTAVTSSARTDISNAPTITNSLYGLQESLGSVRLSKLQSKMQSMSMNAFRVPSDSRSPLLKGLTFPDPLERPRAPVRIPAKATDPLMKPKFDRITAAVKGYLTRRLLHTEKLQMLIQTIRDTVDLLLKLYEEAPSGRSDNKIEPQDLDLHRRSLQQLTGACASFHDVFFKLSTSERMAVIATDREKLRSKALKNEFYRNNPNSPAKRNISTATLKSLERRMSTSTSTQEVSQRRSSHRGEIRSRASAKQNTREKISPKRRRMSHFVPPAPVPIKPKCVPAPPVDTNGNKWRVSDQIRAQSQLNTTYTRGINIETNFSGLGGSNSNVVFSTSQQTNASSRPTTANSLSNYTSVSSNSSRFSIGQSESEMKLMSGRRSVARRTPWK